MDSDALSIRLFLFGSALLLGVEAVKSAGKERVAFGSGSGAFVLLGLFWGPVAKAFPGAATALGEIATFPPSWFFLIVVVFLLLRERWGRSSSGRQMGNVVAEPAEWQMRMEQLAESVSKMTDSLESLEKQFVDLRRDQIAASAQGDRAYALADALRDQANRAASIVDEHKIELNKLRTVADELMAARTAMAHRHAMASLEQDIAETDAKLYFPRGKGVAETDWEEWVENEKLWRSDVRTWCDHVVDYVTEPMTFVTNTPLDSFYGDWSFDESDMPNADTVHRYKAFCIMRRNFRDLRKRADNTTFRAAYL